jgi:hypothetical protein
MIVLFLSELSFYLTTDTIDHLIVDTSKSEILRINVDVKFPAAPCTRESFPPTIYIIESSWPVLSIDVIDVSGASQKDVDHHIIKRRLSQDGKSLGLMTKEGRQLSSAKPRRLRISLPRAWRCHLRDEGSADCECHLLQVLLWC